MPASTPKDLYLASNMGELNKKAEFRAPKVVNARAYVKTAEKLIADAKSCSSLGDEEKSYVLYMRYLDIVGLIKASADYRKQKVYYDALIGSTNLLKSVEEAEALSERLTKRYDLMEAEAVCQKLDNIHKEKEKKKEEEKKIEDKKHKEEANGKKNGENKEEAKVSNGGSESESGLFENGALSPNQLYNLLLELTNQLIVMDVRSCAEFANSHMKHNCVINVPCDIVTPGITVPKIETGLPESSRDLWQKRSQVDYIILLDWDSNIGNVGPGKTLQTLKDALFKFDSTTIIKSEPLILEGGYDDWLLHYPAMTTNSRTDRPLFTKPVSTIPSLDFDYPDLDAAFVQTPTPEKLSSDRSQNGHPLSQLDVITANVEPTVSKSRPNIPDRAKKPTFSSQTSLEMAKNNDLLSGIGKFESSGTSLDSLSRNLYPSVTSIPQNGPLKKTQNISSNSIGRFKSGNAPSQSGKSNIVVEQEKELAELRKLQMQKEAEFGQFQKDRERITLENKARLALLNSRKAELEKLEKMKHQQEKDVADLMRMKRRLEEEMKEERMKTEDEDRRRMDEERIRREELDRIQEEEGERMKRLREVDQLREQRKLREESERRRLTNLSREEQAARLAEQEKERLEAMLIELEKQKEEAEKKEMARKQVEAAEEELVQRKNQEDKTTEDRRKAQLEEEKREQIRLEQEREKELERQRVEEQRLKLEQQRLAEERARQEKECLDRARQEKEQLEREKMEKERLERERQEKLEKERQEKESLERKKVEQAEEAKRIAEERAKKVAEVEKQETARSSNLLLEGWDRRLDPQTNRYYFIDHTTGSTQWDPPQVAVTPSSPAHSKVYKTKLKEEGSTGSRGGGLMRSHSSPNIAQLVEEEEQASKAMPNFDRGAKPTVRRPMPAQSVTNIRPASVKAARMRDLNPVYGSVSGALTGLRNLGNTCYMNSTLQCLNNCLPLVNYFIKDLFVEDINRESKFSHRGEVVDEYAVLVKAMWSEQYRSISPRDFKMVCSRYNELFSTHEQQDSQELLAFLLDGLHEGLNKIKVRPKIEELDTDNIPDHIAAEKTWLNHKLHNQSIIVELFQGELKSTVTCLHCGKKSTRFDVFQYLTLPLPLNTNRCSLTDCLRLFLREEKLTGNSRWKCPVCKVQREAVKKLDIWKLPHILIIHLNRFIYEGIWKSKLNTNVDFPVSGVDLDNIVAGPNKRRPYNLYAVSNHYGTMEGGHYTAYAKNPCSGDWHKFDDHEVYSMSKNDVKSAAAYFLFYTCLEQK